RVRRARCPDPRAGRNTPLRRRIGEGAVDDRPLRRRSRRRRASALVGALDAPRPICSDLSDQLQEVREMRFVRRLGHGPRLALALAVGAGIFGIATAVQADIPDHGVIQGCYGKPGTAYKGQLRVRDADQGEQCRAYENPLSWSQTGPTGSTGPTGP